MSEEAEGSRRKGAGSFFGRRKGKALRPQQEAALRERLPDLILDPSSPSPKDISELFSRPSTHVRLEIGFGGGEHLLHRIRENPDWNFIGVEPFVNGMAKLMVALGDDSGNVRLYDQDAARLLDWLPPASIDHIDLLYPDPWPKPRHNKRRFVSTANTVKLHRVLKPGATFCFASDIGDYVNWTLIKIRQHAGFDFDPFDADDWRKPYDNWPGTRYEAKALREGRVPAHIRFSKRLACI